MILTSLEPSELRAIIKDVLLEFSRENTPAESIASDYISRKETAKRLGITLPTLHRYTIKGRIVGYRIGGKVLYKSQEIDHCLKKIKSR